MTDLDEWLKQQAGDANLEPNAPQQADPAGPWARARELMDRQAGMQYTPSKSFNIPAPEKAPERQDWKTILAMGLNLLGNRGRQWQCG